MLDYHPNASARALKNGSTKLLGLVLSEIINPFHSECIDALDLAAARHGYALLLASTHNDDQRADVLRSSLVERGVEGLVFLSVFPDDTANTPQEDTALNPRVPQLILDRSTAVQGFATVGAQTAEGARMATEHLISHGHRKIAYIEGPLRAVVGDERRAGWQRAMAAAGAEAIGPVVTAWSREGGAEAVRILLDSDRPPTAIFAGSDLMAVGALQALHERGLQVPDDLALVSFDGTAESEYSWPPLTAVRQPFAEMAEAAIAGVVQPTHVPSAQTFPMQLVLRASCGCR